MFLFLNNTTSSFIDSRLSLCSSLSLWRWPFNTSLSNYSTSSKKSRAVRIRPRLHMALRVSECSSPSVWCIVSSVASQSCCALSCRPCFLYTSDNTFVHPRVLALLWFFCLISRIETTEHETNIKWIDSFILSTCNPASLRGSVLTTERDFRFSHRISKPALAIWEILSAYKLVS